MSQEAPEQESPVGYGKPPLTSRFRPGQSGNPRGRPKGSKNGRELLQAELASPVVLKENGKQIKTSKLGVIIKQAVNKAMTKGDLKDFIAVCKHYGLDATPSTTENAEALEGEEDAQTYESFLKRLKGGV